VYYRCAGTRGCKHHYPERTFETHTLALLESLRIDEETSIWLLHELDTQDTTAKNEEHAARLKKRLTELDRLAASAYEENSSGRSTRTSGKNEPQPGSTSAMSYEPNSPATSRSSRTRNSSRQRDTLSNSSNAPRICTLRKNPAKRQDSSKPSCRTTRSRTEVSP